MGRSLRSRPIVAGLLGLFLAPPALAQEAPPGTATPAQIAEARRHRDVLQVHGWGGASSRVRAADRPLVACLSVKPGPRGAEPNLHLQNRCSFALHLNLQIGRVVDGACREAGSVHVGFHPLQPANRQAADHRGVCLREVSEIHVATAGSTSRFEGQWLYAGSLLSSGDGGPRLANYINVGAIERRPNNIVFVPTLTVDATNGEGIRSNLVVLGINCSAPALVVSEGFDYDPSHRVVGYGTAGGPVFRASSGSYMERFVQRACTGRAAGLVPVTGSVQQHADQQFRPRR